MTALCSGKICTIFPEKGALNFWKACTIALEYSHLSFLAREDKVKCLHFLMIIMDSFLGQHNPSNYFALTKQQHLYYI